MIKKLFFTSLTAILVAVFVISSLPINSMELSLINNEILTKTDSTSDLSIIPTSSPELLTRIRTQRFVNSTRYYANNENISIDNIYHRLASIKLIDSTLSNLSLQVKNISK